MIHVWTESSFPTGFTANVTSFIASISLWDEFNQFSLIKINCCYALDKKKMLAISNWYIVTFGLDVSTK